MVILGFGFVILHKDFRFKKFRFDYFAQNFGRLRRRRPAFEMGALKGAPRLYARRE